MTSRLRLLLGLEAPIMTPNGVVFVVFLDQWAYLAKAGVKCWERVMGC